MNTPQRGPSLPQDALMQHNQVGIQRLPSANSPVDMLPNEIFVEILRVTAASLELDGMTWLTLAMAVCRRWRGIIVHTPILWTDIDLTKNWRFVDLCLAYSDGMSINVHVPEQPPDEPQVTVDFSLAFSLLAPHRRRISRLDLRLSSIDWNSRLDRALSSTLEVALPGLVSLHLTTRPGFCLRLQESDLPSLRNLSLGNAAVDWASLQLSRLTSLTLSNIMHSSDHTRSLASLLDLLERCTCLESFTYEHWETLHEQAIANDRVVSLPQMRQFYISGSPEDIAQVIARLSLPREAHLSLALFDLRTEVDSEFPVLAAVLPRDTTHLPALADMRHIMVWFDQYKLLVHADERRCTFWESQGSKSADCKAPAGAGCDDAPALPSLCIVYHLSGSEADDYVLANVARELGAFFPPALETCVLRGAMDVVDTAVWARMLSAFPRVGHLEFIAIACDIKTFPPALAPAPDGVPCPCLRKLVLHYEPNEEDGGRQMLSELCHVLKMRDDAGCRLEALSIQVEPVGIDMIFMPSDVVSRLPPDFEDIERNLESVVGSLEIMLLIDGD
ncbi:hypothetical protein C8Q72DRAFT_12921 [Fomitopsis betulina]|nr:hypothetical protein C8Q72DRAFT_12921 [Fomitopsis betulina]